MSDSFNIHNQPATIDKIAITASTSKDGETAYEARLTVKMDPNLAGLRASPFGQYVGNDTNGVNVKTTRKADYGTVDVTVGALEFAATFASKAATLEAEDGVWALRFGLDVAVDEAAMVDLIRLVKVPTTIGIVSRHGQGELFEEDGADALLKAAAAFDAMGVEVEVKYAE